MCGEIVKSMGLSLERRDEVAAIDHDFCAGHEGAGIRSEQKQRAIEVRHLAEPPLRNSRDQGLSRRGGEEIAVDIRLDIAWAEGVDADPVARPFQAQGCA